MKKNSSYLIIGGLFLFFFSFAPVVKGASHVYTCAELSNNTGTPSASCSVNTITFFGGDGGVYESPTTPNFTFVDGEPYYFVFRAVGSGTVRTYITGDDTSVNEEIVDPSGEDQFFLLAPTENEDPNFLLVQSLSADPFTGEVTYICVSDVGYTECADTPATSTATTTTYVVNESQNLFMGLVLFFISFFFIVWYFRGKVVN